MAYDLYVVKNVFKYFMSDIYSEAHKKCIDYDVENLQGAVFKPKSPRISIRNLPFIPSSSFITAAIINYSDKKLLMDEMLLFDSQFQVAVHHCGGVKVGTQSITSTLKSRKRAWNLACLLIGS